MKKNEIFIVLILLLLIISLVGCKISPTAVNQGKWYFENVIIDNVTYSPGEYTEKYHKEYFYDYCLFDFKEDKSITVYKYYNNEIVANGTYYIKKKTVYINFDNGDSFVGIVNKYMFDGVWYDFSLENEKVKINLNVGTQNSSNYSVSKDRYYATYSFANLNDFVSLFYSKERNDEIIMSFENSYDNKISNEFKTLYNELVNDQKILVVPNIYRITTYYSIFVRSTDQYMMPWISYICYDEKGNNYDLHIMYLDEELHNYDRELNDLLNKNRYAKKEFEGIDYTYFIYNCSELEYQCKLLVRVKPLNQKEIENDFLNNITFEPIVKKPVIQ